MTGRYYAGRVVAPEYCPVTDFTDARCRQFDEGYRTHAFIHFFPLRQRSAQIGCVTNMFTTLGLASVVDTAISCT
jgi:hypothetical protein